MNADTYHLQLPAFLAEAANRLDDIDAATLTLVREPGNVDALSVLSCAAHAIKARAASLGLRAVVIEAQRIEWWANDATPSRASATLALNAARSELHRLLDEVGLDLEQARQ